MDLSRGIDLEQYKTQAKELLRQSRAGDADALRRIAHHHRRYATPSPPDPQTLRLADAQLVIARENGLRSWTRFKSYLVFLQARRAFDHGDLPALTAVLDAHPTVVGYRCHESEPTEFGFDIYASGYFMGATLLHHVAGNPIRCPLPATSSTSPGSFSPVAPIRTPGAANPTTWARPSVCCSRASRRRKPAWRSP